MALLSFTQLKYRSSSSVDIGFISEVRASAAEGLLLTFISTVLLALFSR
jgi:hypothetical protein